MKKKALAAMLTFALAAGVMAGCGSTGSSSSAPAEAEESAEEVQEAADEAGPRFRRLIKASIQKM